jgi:thiosulfate dehydrogenase [quinone] large subunit
MSSPEARSFAALRIVFGAVWAIDAYFKWQPAFINNFTSYLLEGAQGQGPLVQGWINLWVHTVGVNPELFAYLVALGETGIALGLLFGLFTRMAMAGGIALAFVIWSTAEGFGGPYVAGSTDIGAAIIYVLLFFALWFGKSWRTWSIDGWLKKKYHKRQ